MRLLYEIFLRAYYLGVWLVAPFNTKAKKWISGRKKTFEDLENFAIENQKNIWVHCASVGEFEQGLPLIQKLEKQFPELAILISFFSPSGYEYAAKKFPKLTIIYLPLDTKSNSKKWVKILNPMLVIFVKYEFWHHYFHSLKTAQIPLLMVSAIFWKDLFFFKSYGAFFRKSLRQVTHFFVQNEESKRLLNNIDLKNVTISGDARFERVIAIKEEPFHDEKIEKFIGTEYVFILGSVWQNDLAVIKKIILVSPLNSKFIIAPHEIEHFPYDQFANFITQKYSENCSVDLAQILFLDTIGMLSRSYRYAKAAYIGGGFGKGIHNILEAAVYNIPILSGPNIHRFAEAKTLQKMGILTVLNSESDIEKLALENMDLKASLIEGNTKYFEQNTNVTDDIVVFIKKHGFLD